MELKVDRDLCEANAVCCGLAPDVFELDDDELLIVKQPHPPAEQSDRVRKAVERCRKNPLALAPCPPRTTRSHRRIGSVSPARSRSSRGPPPPWAGPKPWRS